MTAEHVSHADTVQILIADIEVGRRRRKRLGALQSLQRSIAKHGLIHPVLVRNGTELVAGARRLEACKRLGWPSIPARRVDHLSDEELRALELEENTERRDLDTYEKTMQRLAEIRQAAADAKREAETRSESEQVSRKGRRGPARTPGSKRDVAERTGIPIATQARVERTAAATEQYPFMRRVDAGWAEYRVLEANEKLNALPERERPKVASLLDQPDIPAEKAIDILGNLGRMEPAGRQEIYRLNESEDKQDRRLAFTKAAEPPPPPDPGILRLMEAGRLVREAAASCRVPGFKSQITAIATRIEKLVKNIERAKDTPTS